MHEPHNFNWLQYVPPPARAIDIKVEPSASDSPALSLQSPPSSPPFSRSDPSPPVPFASSNANGRRRSFTSSLTSPKRTKPYPAPPRELRNRPDSGEMSVPYGSWTSSGIRGGNPKVHYTAERRSSDSDESSSFTLSNTFPPTVSYLFSSDFKCYTDFCANYSLSLAGPPTAIIGRYHRIPTWGHRA
jgi:hypothetical protein